MTLSSDRHWRHELRGGDSIDHEIKRLAGRRRLQITLDIVADGVDSTFALKVRGASGVPILCGLGVAESERALAERIVAAFEGRRTSAAAAPTGR
ncbi:MAG TPA: hypothetical protein VN715_22230 [Roseiarcus sp.]|nr:hypothetical protein [Roseiarcus sp.]